MNKYTFVHTWAQEEHREFNIEAESFMEAMAKLKALREGDYFFEEKEDLGDVVKDHYEVCNEGTVLEFDQDSLEGVGDEDNS
jgi:hypothetical protein